jgi:hypothetical protein
MRKSRFTEEQIAFALIGPTLTLVHSRSDAGQNVA